jgi:hypothetical protein
MRDDEIFRRLKKEKPLVKRKDLQPLSQQDFAPKRSSFDMLMEKTNDKRAERRSTGYRAGTYQKSDVKVKGEGDTKHVPEQEGLSLHADTERIQRPQPRSTIQTRSETRIRTSPEPLSRPEPRTFNVRTAGTQRVETERVQRPEGRTVSSGPQNPLQTEPPRPESRTESVQLSGAQRIEPERVQPTPSGPQDPLQQPLPPESRTVSAPSVAPQKESERMQPASPSPQNPLQPEAPRSEGAQPVKAATQIPPAGYAQPPRKRMDSIREAYTHAEATELEIFGEAAPGRRPELRNDGLKITQMRSRRTEFEEYYEPATGQEAVPTFRHELKYYINYREYIVLRNTLKALAQIDKYAGESGEYAIRSLYFDDVYESALMQKLGGSDYRKKYRIRIYNFSDDVIKFEKKIKHGQFVTKKSIHISRGEYDKIIAGEYEFLLRRKEPLAGELFLELKNNRLRPRVIVDYVREAYVYPFENIRITFDKDLHSCTWLNDLFDPKTPTMPMYEEGMMVLEVKFEKSLPPHIRGVLNNIDAAQRSAISKYVICRKFE